MISQNEWIENELDNARELLSSGQPELAFRHLERAHVVGQNSTGHHVRAHYAMLKWALVNRQLGEAAGQVFRMFGALTKTVFGLVPKGNTGGSNVSPFRSMPIPDDLQIIIDQNR